jgi:hypothetical protein
MVLESAPTTRLVMCARCCIVACIPNWGVLSWYVCGPRLSGNNCKAHRSAQSAQTVIDFLDWTGHHRRSNPHPLFVHNILGGDFFTHPVFFSATRCYRIHSLAIHRRLGLADLMILLSPAGGVHRSGLSLDSCHIHGEICPCHVLSLWFCVRAWPRSIPHVWFSVSTRASCVSCSCAASVF